jgi:hypothetical protein
MFVTAMGKAPFSIPRQSRETMPISTIPMHRKLAGTAGRDVNPHVRMQLSEFPPIL